MTTIIIDACHQLLLCCRKGHKTRMMAPDGCGGGEGWDRSRDVLSVWPTEREGGVSWKFWVGGCPNSPLPSHGDVPKPPPDKHIP